MVLSSLKTRIVPKFGSIVRNISTKYKKNLEKHPYLVQAVQTSILSGAGDLAAQALVERRDFSSINYIRTLKFAGIGFLFAGPGIRAWYAVLDSRVTAKKPVIRTIKKVLLDQLVFTPVFLASLLSIISYSQKQDIGYVQDKLRHQYFDILLTGYSVWPLVQLINFGFVPLNYQVLVTQTVAFLWNIYFSWKTNLTIKVPVEDASDIDSHQIVAS